MQSICKAYASKPAPRPAGHGRRGGPAPLPGGYADYIVNHERKPGIGALAGWRGADGEVKNPEQLDRYIENGGFRRDVPPAAMQFHRHVNRDYLDYAREMGFIAGAAPIVMRIYSEPPQRFRLGRLDRAVALRRVAAWGWFVPSFALLAAIFPIAGGLIERWLFFAEAKHSVILYYGGDAAREPGDS